MSALSLPAVGGLEWQGGVTFSAHLLVAVEFLCNSSDGGVHHTASQSQYEMQGGLLLDVVVGKGSSI